MISTKFFKQGEYTESVWHFLPKNIFCYIGENAFISEMVWDRVISTKFLTQKVLQSHVALFGQKFFSHYFWQPSPIFALHAKQICPGNVVRYFRQNIWPSVYTLSHLAIIVKNIKHHFFLAILNFCLKRRNPFIWETVQERL